MARFLFATVPFTGHVNPGLPIAGELVRRGHDVRWYSTPRFQKSIEAVGVRYVPYDRALVLDEHRLDEQFPKRASLKGLNQLKFDLNNVFIDPAPLAFADLEAEFKREPADVVVGDSACAAPGLLHEKYGIPWAVFGITVFSLSSQDTAPFGLGMLPNASPAGRFRNRALQWIVENVVFRDPIANFHRRREELGFGPSPYSLFDAVRGADLILQSCVPAFEYPRSDLPEQVQFIGSFVPAPPPDWQAPDWWADLDGGRPVVLVTQGTIANDYDDLIRPAIRALASQDVLVVVTTGSKPAEAVQIDPLPTNVRVERFVPYAHLMPKVNLLLTNGGYGSVQIALSHGVPVVSFGASEEKPEIANRVQWSGVGLGVKAKRPSPDQIATAVEKVLGTPGFHERARALQAELAAYDAARLAGDYLEGLIPT